MLMAKNVCPNCQQVTISFDSEEDLECPICGTVFQIKDSDKGSTDINFN